MADPLKGTAEWARWMVTQVREAAYDRRDAEAAHSLEDDLYREALLMCERGEPVAREMARIALETQGWNFSRWCA